MKKEHKLYVIVGLLVLLGIAVYFVMGQEDTHAQAPSATAAQDLPVVKLTKEDADKITKFVVKNADKGEVTLEKKGEKWELTSGTLTAAANEANVKSIVENVQKIELSAIIGDNAAIHEKYELTDAKGVHVQAFKGDQKAMDLVFGKSGGRGQMVRLGDGANPTVYASKGYSSFLWAREVKTWRHNEIITFEDKNAIAVEVENEHGKFSFTKAEDTWSGKFYARDKDGKLAEKPADIERFEETKITSLLGALKALKATNFAEAGDDTGVDDPLKHGGVIRITMKDEDKPKYVLSVGKKQEGSNRYVASEGDKNIYIITTYAADWATAKVDKFQKAEKKEGEEGDEEMGEEGEGEGDDHDHDEDADKDKDTKEDKKDAKDKGDKGKGDTGKGDGKGGGKGGGKGDGKGAEKPAPAPAPKPAPAPAPK